MIKDLIYLGILFIVLALSADYSIQKIRILAQLLHVPLYMIGIILGLLTTLPEFFIGLNALMNNVTPLIIGNIFGGIILLLSFFLGFNLFFASPSKNTFDSKLLYMQLGTIMITVFLGLKGSYTFIDGLIIFFLYVVVMWVYCRNATHNVLHNLFVKHEGSFFKVCIPALCALFILIFTAHLSVETAEKILSRSHISPLLIGVLLFAIGTNLPELILMITSWFYNTIALSIGHILSSAFANICALGLLCMLQPFTFTVDRYYYLMCGTIILIACALIMYALHIVTNNRLLGGALIMMFCIYMTLFLRI